MKKFISRYLNSYRNKIGIAIMLLASISALAFTMLTYKSQRQTETIYNNLIGSLITFPFSDMERVKFSNHATKEPKYTLISYVDKEECNSCRIKELANWQFFLNEINRGSSLVRLIMIFSPPQNMYSFIKHEISVSEIDCEAYMDSSSVFRNANMTIPNNPKLHVFLADNEGKVILVGNPITNNCI